MNNAIVVEYAENIDAAENNAFEDGDLFFIDELADDAVFSAILAEIEAG